MHMFENIIEYEKNVLFKKDTIDIIPPKKMTGISKKYQRHERLIANLQPIENMDEAYHIKHR